MIRPNLNIVLVEPEIPQNTGNIARTCVAIGARLHLIRPFGFVISDRAIKRSGMDYWQRLDLVEHEDLESFLGSLPKDAKVFPVTTKARKNHAGVSYPSGAWLLFGKESAGLPEELILDYRETAVRIPMVSGERSLNLSNAVAILAYEALRQNDFSGLESQGNLHRLSWENELGTAANIKE